MTDKQIYNIGKWGVPKEMASCPGCGREYGFRGRSVCVKCQECSKCCGCKNPELKTMSESILASILKES
jgi:hypothetical protein